MKALSTRRPLVPLTMMLLITITMFFSCKSSPLGGDLWGSDDASEDGGSTSNSENGSTENSSAVTSDVRVSISAQMLLKQESTEEVCTKLDYDGIQACVEEVENKINTGEIEKSDALEALDQCFADGGESEELCTDEGYDEIKGCVDTVDDLIATGEIEKSEARDKWAECTGAAVPGDDDDDDGQIKECSEFFGGASEVVKVTGNQQTLSLKPTDAVFVKVTGNKNKVEVLFEAVDDQPAAFAGICFFLTGNQAKADVDLKKVELAKFGYRGRGNSPVATLDIDEDSTVSEFLVDLKGNGGKLEINGPGTYECPAGKEKNGKKTEIVCNP